MIFSIIVGLEFFILLYFGFNIQIESCILKFVMTIVWTMLKITTTRIEII